MSLTGRLKHYVGDSPDLEPYECRSCGATFDTRYHVCPDCGGFRVERQQWNVID